MTETNDLLATRWTRVAERAPGIAVRQWIARTLLALVAIVGALNLLGLTRWGWRSSQAGLVVLIAVHVIALVIAIGLPLRRDVLAAPERSMARVLRGYGDRADRLRALAIVMTIELGVRFALPPVMTLVAGNLLRWPAEFVVTGAACLVVWPLQRIAASQRAETERLSAMDP
jgi:hypothetical protein